MRPYQIMLAMVVLAFVTLIVTTFVVTFTQTSPAFRYDLVRPATSPPTFSTTGFQTTAPPTIPPTGAPTTAAPTGAPTTGAPTFAPLQIICPADLQLPLGSSLSPTFTGGSPVASGGCSTPVLQYDDIISGVGVPSIARSPSIPNPNLFLWATQPSQDITGQAGARVSVSPAYVVVTTQGGRVAIIDKSVPGSEISSFHLANLPNANASFCGAARDSYSASIVIWDSAAQRWVGAQWSNTTGTGGILCLYASWTANPSPAAGWEGMSMEFGQFASSFQLAVWGRTYAITLSQDGMPMVADPLCVLDRAEFLAFNATLNPNATAPPFFCDAPLNSVAHPAWGGWSPVHADSDVPLSVSSESAGAGTPGAVFLRPIDDEYQLGSMITPNTDYVEVEHWYNLNWTTGTHGTVRYRNSVADFSQMPGSTCGAKCVPTPTGTNLTAQQGSFSQVPVYRRRTDSEGQHESVVMALTSHSNGVNVSRVYWFELRWQTPTTGQLEPVWLLYQQGVSVSTPTSGIHQFLPGICMDANGTIALGYSVSSSATTYPGLWASSRLGNDPLGTLRTPIMLHEGALGSVISPADLPWGPSWTMACDPGVGRWFYFAGAVSDLTEARVTHLDRIRVLGEIVERHWRANDFCGAQVNCTQYITTV